MSFITAIMAVILVFFAGLTGWIIGCAVCSLN
jgi:hypothetical protein